jgi:hypothetical protein
MIRKSFTGIAFAIIAGCAPRAVPLAGAPTPAHFPRAELPPGHQQVTFTWRYKDDDLTVDGEGVARIAAPDSARLDFFVSGGMGGGTAVLIGNTLDAPGPSVLRRLIPPAPLMWAALGRLALPPAADTAARQSGDTLRADVGRGEVWRATFVGARLARVDHLDGGRVREHLVRDSPDAVRYESDASRRSLTITVSRRADVQPFDVAIWSR